MDLISQLLADGGGQKFLAAALLYLDPDDLKACRLVCSAWDKFIRENVWGLVAGRSVLERRLLNRWRNVEASLTMVEIAVPVYTAVWGLFSNNAHIFLGSGKVVAVYSLDGAWIKDLVPVEKMPHDIGYGVFGGKGIVAAAFSHAVTLWSSELEMDELFCFEMRKYHPSSPTPNIHQIQVAVDKVAILASKAMTDDKGKHFVIALEKNGNGRWNAKTLGDFLGPLSSRPCLACDTEWVAVVLTRLTQDEPNTTLRLWRQDEAQQDVTMPVSLGRTVDDITLKHPFVILGLLKIRDWTVRNEPSINVYKLESGVTGGARLMKSIRSFGNFTTISRRFSSNSFFFGFAQRRFGEDTTLHLFELQNLLDENISEEQTWTRKIGLTSFSYKFGMNKSSIVWFRGEVSGKSRKVHLCKKDFWMGKTSHQQLHE